jgi:hypothetical protein
MTVRDPSQSALIALIQSGVLNSYLAAQGFNNSTTPPSELAVGANVGVQVTAGPDVGFFGATPIAKPTVTGSKASGAALASLLTTLATLGLIVDGTST